MHDIEDNLNNPHGVMAGPTSFVSVRNHIFLYYKLIKKIPAAACFAKNAQFIGINTMKSWT